MNPADHLVLRTLGVLCVQHDRAVGLYEILNALGDRPYRAVGRSLARLVRCGLVERSPRVRGVQPTVRYEAVVR